MGLRRAAARCWREPSVAPHRRGVGTQRSGDVPGQQPCPLALPLSGPGSRSTPDILLQWREARLLEEGAGGAPAGAERKEVLERMGRVEGSGPAGRSRDGRAGPV